jgi:hypothetical protein
MNRNVNERSNNTKKTTTYMNRIHFYRDNTMDNEGSMRQEGNVDNNYSDNGKKQSFIHKSGL